MKNKAFVFLFLLVSILSLSDIAEACICAKRNPCDAYYKADLVFIGKVVSHKIRFTINKDGSGSDDGDIYKFKITEVFSATTSNRISKIKIFTGNTSCDMGFELNKNYLVYAWKTEEGYSTNRCQRTTELTSAKEDLKFLREELPKPDVKPCSIYDSAGLTFYRQPISPFFL